MSNLKRKQHVLPESYLKQWVDPATVAPNKTPMIWVHTKEDQRRYAKNPAESHFYRDYFYDMVSDTGERDQSLEEALSKIENAMPRVLNDRLPNKMPLEPNEVEAMNLFVGATYMRTERKRKLVLGFVQTKSLIEKEYGEAYGKAIPDRSRDEHNAHPIAVFTAIEAISEEVRSMSHGVFISPAGKSFVTSDDPCVWSAIGPVGLRNRTIQITLPLSPSHLLYISHDPLGVYAAATDQDIDDLNRRTILGCEKYFISNSREIDPHWLK